MVEPWQKQTLRPWAWLALAVALSGFLLNCATPTPTPSPTTTPTSTPVPLTPTPLPYLSKIAYVVGDMYRNSEVWMMNGDGTGKQSFRKNAHSPAWSPDGKRIAYVRFYGYERREIRIVTSDGLSDQMVLSVERAAPLLLRWAPDGRAIFYELARFGTDAPEGSINFLDLSNLRPKEIGLWGSFDVSKRDGSLVFVQHRQSEAGKGKEPWSLVYRCQDDIMAADKEGRNPRQVLTGEVREREGVINPCYPWEFHHAVWSPDGRKIAFWRFDFKSGDSILATADANGENLRQLWRTQRPDSAAPSYYVSRFNLAWSPDGKRIVYSFPDTAEADPPSEIWIINADGSGSPNKTADGYNPSWAFVPAAVEAPPTPTPVPAGTPPSATEVRFFSPALTSVAQQVDGRCWTSSIADPGRAFRCSDESHRVYDPCFLAQDDGIQGPPYLVVCLSSPWDSRSEGLRVQSLPKPEQPIEPTVHDPWALELFDGTRCRSGPTGTTFVLRIDGKEYGVRYVCDDERVVVYPPGAVKALQQGQVWRAMLVTGDWGKAAKEPEREHGDTLKLSTVPVRVVWY